MTLGSSDSGLAAQNGQSGNPQKVAPIIGPGRVEVPQFAGREASRESVRTRARDGGQRLSEVNTA